MSEPFVGEIRMFGFTYPPRGWALCNGQIMSINQNQALFALLGTTYGGNGTTTFALPDLRGRVPLHTGNGVSLGQSAGEESHTLTQAEMPQHTHQMAGSSAAPNQKNVEGQIWAADTATMPFHAGPPSTTMNAASMGAAGGGQAHSNMQPYLTVNFCIALQGIFPSRN